MIPQHKPTPELPVKSKHAALLNALFEMQHAMAYALRRSVLAEAEAVIVDMERVERLQQERIAELEKKLASS